MGGGNRTAEGCLVRAFGSQFVIPAQAGIQQSPESRVVLDPGFRRDDVRLTGTMNNVQEFLYVTSPPRYTP